MVCPENMKHLKGQGEKKMTKAILEEEWVVVGKVSILSVCSEDQS